MPKSLPRVLIQLFECAQTQVFQNSWVTLRVVKVQVSGLQDITLPHPLPQKALGTLCARVRAPTDQPRRRGVRPLPGPRSRCHPFEGPGVWEMPRGFSLGPGLGSSPKSLKPLSAKKCQF